MTKRQFEEPFKIPPRWLNCPRKGALISDKFIAFKTPLDSKYNDQVPEAQRFDMDMFLSSVHSTYGKRIGIVIDLTNTRRFYDRAAVENTGCKYIKLQCRGHGETPSVDQTQTFVNLCYNYIRQHPLELIGVHCTHGFNRTGFLIISYLIERMDWGVSAALQSFSCSRPPGIYKQDYINELFTRYDEYEKPSAAPVLPNWCTESDDSVDDDGRSIEPSHSPSKRPRVDGNSSQKVKKIEGVRGIEQVLHPGQLAQVQMKVQDMCGWKQRGFPGSQPVSMDQDNLSFLKETKFMVSWKADGTRFMMLIDGPGQVFLVDRDNCVFHVSKLHFPKRKSPDLHLSKTLVDGELVLDEDKTTGVVTPRYLIYDIIKFEGQDVGKTDFARRMTCIKKEIEQPRYEAIQKGKINRAEECFGVRMKEFYPVRESTTKLLSPSFTKKVGHELDGLVFQPAGSHDTYHCGQQKDLLKWKPPHLNTVDFKLTWVKEDKLGMIPKTVGQLFVGSLDRPFAQFKFSKALKDLNNKIIECSWDFEGKQWKFLRERTDKSFPNSYNTAKAVCDSIQRPVTQRMLLEFIDKHSWKPFDGMPPPMGPPSHR